MNIDKMMMIVYSIIVIILIIGVAFMGGYGSTISKDPNFVVFFSWFIGLLLLNLFNILVNLIYYYFKRDLVGPKGLKGEQGDRGKEGNDKKCFCGEGGSSVSLGPAIDEVNSYPLIVDGGHKGTVLTEHSEKIIEGPSHTDNDELHLKR